MKYVLVAFCFEVEREQIPHLLVLFNLLWGTGLPGKPIKRQGTVGHGKLMFSS